MRAVTALIASTVPPQYAKRNTRTAGRLGNAKAGASDGVPSQEKP
jgi:hypothetical protein